MKKILADFRKKMLPIDPVKKQILSKLDENFNIILSPEQIRLSDKNVKIYIPVDLLKGQTQDMLQSALNDIQSDLTFYVVIDQEGSTSFAQPKPPTESKAKEQTPQKSAPFGRHGQKGKIDRSNIKTIISVASGKGGVGKSTISLNLARSFVRMGLKTGLIDADIHGPSLPIMTGGYAEAKYDDGKLIPHMRDNIKCMSIGFMVNPAKPIIWRGPLVSGAIQQMFSDVNWGDLDIMVIDMPPGTGDAQLTLCQSVAPDASVIVSTPQLTAVIDAERCAAMFTQLNTPIIGVIENMRGFTAPDTGKEYFIFGSGGAESFAKTYHYPYLGHLPFEMHLPYMTDKAQDPATHKGGEKIAAQFDDFTTQILSNLKTYSK